VVECGRIRVRASADTMAPAAIDRAAAGAAMTACARLRVVAGAGCLNYVAAQAARRRRMRSRGRRRAVAQRSAARDRSRLRPDPPPARSTADHSVRMRPAPGMDNTATVQDAVTQRRQRTRTSAHTPPDPHAHPLAGPLGARGAFR
jgi:hypothetical protein